MIAGSSLVLSAPFIAAFFYKHRKAIMEVRPHFNQFMENFFDSKFANGLVCAWAALEALVWFVVPEYLLLLIVFMRRKRKSDLLWYDIAGTIIGTILGFILRFPAAFLEKIPYVYPSMLEQTAVWYTNEGLFGLIHQPFSGVPYKVFVALAPGFGFAPILFLAVALVMRLSRYAMFYGVFWALYPVLHKVVYRHYAILIILGFVVFTFMLMKVSATYAAGYHITTH